MLFLNYILFLTNNKFVKKYCAIFFVVIFSFFSFFCVQNTCTIFASPEGALNQEILAEKLLIKLQNSKNTIDKEIEQMYKYLDLICHENTQFYVYKIKEIEQLMDEYRNYIILKARSFATTGEYKQAVEFLESKSEIFKDKSTITSLISHYSKYFVKDGLFYYDGSAKILSLNKLIAYPELAFSTENANCDNLDNLYLTSKEFQNLLEELYLNDYILISLSDYIELSDNNVYKKDLYLPPNKTPIILFFNEINYSETDCAFIEKFVIDGKDNIACYNSKQAEKNQISYTSDFIPLLESFLANHPDFSPNGAKATICFDSHDGILGYNINKTNPNLGQDSLTLKKLVSKLKLLGYEFGYGNFDKSFYSIKNFDEEILFIKNNILPIFGTINIYFSPFEYNKNNEYYNKLENIGFKIFVDYNKNGCYIKNQKVFLSSFFLNGKVLREKPKQFNIDYEKIYDHNSRTKIF